MKNAKKFVLIFILVSVILTALSACQTSLQSQDNASSGENLDGYFAKISYHNYVLYGTGHYQAFSLTYDYTYYQKKKTALADILNDLKDSFEKNGYSVSVDTFSGKLIAEYEFSTTEEYLKATGYNGFEISSNNASEITKSAFYTTYTYRLKTIFTDINKDYKYIGRLLSEGCTKAGISNEYIMLDYIYGTPYSNKSLTSDCDKLTYSQDSKIYLHDFIMTVDTCDREIMLSHRVPNTTIWYILSIVGGIVVVSVPMSIIIVKKKKGEK